MTFKEAKANGYSEGDWKLFRGYVSRKTDIDKQPTHIAAGRRKGQLYIEAPNPQSSRFAYRIYLVKETSK